MQSAPKLSRAALIYIVSLFDMLAAAMTVTTLSSYFKDRVGISATSAGFFGSVYGFVQFFSGPIIGGESDIHGIRTVLILSLVMCIPAYLLLCTKSVFLILGSRILAGCFKHTQSLLRAYVGSVYAHDHQLKMYGRINAIGNVGFIFGPVCAGHISQHFGHEVVFGLTAVLFSLNACLTYAYFRPLHSSTDVQTDANRNLVTTKGSQRNILRLFMSVDWPRHWDLLLTRFLMSFSVLIYRSNFEWLLKEKFGADMSFVGYVTSYQGVISCVSSFYTKSVARNFQNTVMFSGYVSLSICLIILGLISADSIWTYCVFIGMFCIATSFMRAVGYDLSTERCDKSEVGLVLGVSASVVSAARAISPAVGGSLHDISRDLPAVVAVLCAFVSFLVTVFCSNPAQMKYKQTKVN